MIARGSEKLATVAEDTDRASLQAAFDAIVAAHGGLDILVNNAGIARTAPFLDMEEADWRVVIDTGLAGVWRCGQIAARVMVRGGKGGTIVNIASILGQVVQPPRPTMPRPRPACYI